MPKEYKAGLVELENSESSGTDNLTLEHRQYLEKRHGTADLNPLPNFDDNDPLNWPRWKKHVNIALVSWHTFMGTFSVASIMSSFVTIGKDLEVSPQQTSYLVSLCIAILGVALLLWGPLTSTYGRRPIFLLSLICSAVGNVGCALSHSYSTMGLCRAIATFFICPPSSMGSGVVEELFFQHERGAYMGVWASMSTLGIPLGPLVFGFVAVRMDYRWIFYIIAITNAVQFIIYFFFGEETRYIPGPVSAKGQKDATPGWHRLITFRRIDPKPLRISIFIQPLTLLARPRVLLAAVAHAMGFLIGNIVLCIEIPILFPEKFGFNSQQVGLQYIAVIVGTIIGNEIGGNLSDKVMRWRTKAGQPRKPEFRLWFTYGGTFLIIVGTIVFLLVLVKYSSWSVVPLVGVALSAAGNQIGTNVYMTYAIDCYQDDAAAVGISIVLVRLIWGFIGPFWFPNLLAEAGFGGSVGAFVALLVGISILPTIYLQWKAFA